MSVLKDNKIKINYNLEALRGLAALFVVFHHISFFHTDFDSFYFPEFLAAIEPNGHFCVLIFFMLSGYVIGISNKKPLTLNTIPVYLKKRFVRIYPIYVISIILALLVSKITYPLSVILGNLAFVQIFVVKIISENNPIWSLNYEVFYYLLFILISYFNINPFVVLITSFLIAIVNLFGFYNFQLSIISSYSFGFVFWVVGLCVARYYKQETKLNFQLLLSNVFLILSTGYIHLYYTGFHQLMQKIIKLPLNYPISTNWAKSMIVFDDLSYLPYCCIFILNFTSKDYKYRKYITIFVQFLPVIMIPYLIHKSIRDHVLLSAIFSTIFYIISLLLFVQKTAYLEALSKWIINQSIKIGGISYALYIIHLPLLLLFGRLHFFEYTGFEYSIRLMLYLTITLSVSYLLEKKYQSVVSNFLK